jgi:hypothetical protein
MEEQTTRIFSRVYNFPVNKKSVSQDLGHCKKNPIQIILQTSRRFLATDNKERIKHTVYLRFLSGRQQLPSVAVLVLSTAFSTKAENQTVEFIACY